MIQKVINGDCLDVMQKMKESCVDSIVTDPPYGLSFMGKDWDHGVPGVAFWKQALRVLKPGGHLLAFGGSRTYHRLASAIEDAGFEIRDQIMWLYGSGFPKSLDVSKAIDKAAGAEREVVGPNRFDGVNGRENATCYGKASRPMETTASTDSARKWSGWGTALKPAHEPIVVARKPLIGTVAENVLAHGTGAMNIDGCRVETSDTYSYPNGPGGCKSSEFHYQGRSEKPAESNPLGRWPANVIHDGSEEVVERFPNTGSPKPARTGKRGGRPLHEAAGMGSPEKEGTWPADTGGSAARFFYCAKASNKDRNEGVPNDAEKVHGPSGDGRCWDIPGSKSTPRANNHPTVKPTELMRYLCRLVTPPGGIVLDPFMGSGSTGKAAKLEGFHFVGIEKEEKYCEIARSRLSI